MEKNKCPHCGRGILRDRCAVMMKTRDPEMSINSLRESHSSLNGLLEDQEEKNSERVKKYNEIHAAMGGESARGSLRGTELFLTLVEWLDLKKKIENLTDSEEAPEASMELLMEMKMSMEPEDLPSAPAANTKEGEKLYYFREHRRNNGSERGNNSEFIESDLMYGGAPLFFIRRVCPHCYHLLPEEVLMYPVYRIQLVAPPECGKTSALEAIYENLDTFNQKLGGDIMKIYSIQEALVDDDFREFTIHAKRFRDAQMMKIGDKDALDHAPTPLNYIPPLFFCAEVQTEKEVKHVVLAIYDCGGELYNPDRNTMDVYLNADRVRDMDALWVMVDAKKATGRTALDDLKLEPEELETAATAGKGRVHTNDEQHLLEQPFAADDIPVGKLIDYLLICAEAEMGRVDPEEAVHAKRLDMKSRSKEVLTTLIRRMGGSKAMREAAEHLDLAMIITKADYLRKSNQIPEEERECFYDMTHGYFDHGETESRVVRSMIMDDWIADWDLLDFDRSAFRKVEYHFIAARNEENPLEFAPIRVEEPLVYAVMNTISRLNEE